VSKEIELHSLQILGGAAVALTSNSLFVRHTMAGTLQVLASSAASGSSA